MLQNYKLFLSYDGTDYHGWQRQPKKRTIQGTLENALEEILRKKTSLIGAGRTDAGVHASGQVAHFKTKTSMKEDEIFRALNSVLPRDIRVNYLSIAQADFHARKSAKSKIYQYRILNARDASPFLIRYTLHWASPIDVESMKKAAPIFIRKHDFTPFSSNRLLHPVREITLSEIRKKGKEIVYTVEANGFLRYMVRTIVGTLLEIGRGKITPEEIDEIFKEGKRSQAGPTAPARGLCLIKVNY